MASDENYMECILRIDTSVGWEMSVTKVLGSFQGKTEPQIILKHLKKGGKHATIHWVSYGLKRADQPQQHFPENGHNNFYGQNPYYHAQDPYETSYQLYPPQLPWYNTNHFPQNALHGQHGLEHKPSRHSEGKSSARRSHHHHCPVHSRHGHSPEQDSSTPSTKQAEATHPPVNRPTSDQPSSRRYIKKVTGKILSSCLCLCFKK